MLFARAGFELGLFSNQREAQLDFWQHAVGLTYDHSGKLRGGIQQHRHQLADAVLRMNHARDRLQAAPSSGYHALQIVTREITAATRLTDPEGNRVTLLPAREESPAYALVMRVKDPVAHARFIPTRSAFSVRRPVPSGMAKPRLFCTRQTRASQLTCTGRDPGFVTSLCR